MTSEYSELPIGPEGRHFDSRPTRWPERRYKFKTQPGELEWWRALHEQDALFHQHVLFLAHSVAFAMYVCDAPEHADEFLTVMCAALPDHTSYLLDVVREARRLHAEWKRAGEITDEFVALIVYGADA